MYDGYRVFPGCKERPGRDVDPSPPSSAVVMKEKSYIFTSPMGRMACTEPQCLYKGPLPTHHLISAGTPSILVCRNSTDCVCVICITFPRLAQRSVLSPFYMTFTIPISSQYGPKQEAHFTIQQATMAQKVSRDIVLLFL
jgi:hypothetical protein